MARRRQKKKSKRFIKPVDNVAANAAQKSRLKTPTSKVVETSKVVTSVVATVNTKTEETTRNINTSSISCNKSPERNKTNDSLSIKNVYVAPQTSVAAPSVLNSLALLQRAIQGTAQVSVSTEATKKNKTTRKRKKGESKKKQAISDRRLKKKKSASHLAMSASVPTVKVTEDVVVVDDTSNTTIEKKSTLLEQTLSLEPTISPVKNVVLQQKTQKPKSSINGTKSSTTSAVLTATPAGAWLKRKTSSRGRNYTVSVAIPGSIIANCQSRELQTYVAGQIARAIGVFCVDEVIIYDDGSASVDEEEENQKNGKSKCRDWHHHSVDANVFLARIMQYVETPQYLRKALFPVHQDLRLAGLLNPLDAPHHLRRDMVCSFREGVTLNRPTKKGVSGTWVDVGVYNDLLVDAKIPPNVRVTVRLTNPSQTVADPHSFGDNNSSKRRQRQLTGTVVSPNTPREENGIYWGYQTRIASSFSAIWENCPFKDENGKSEYDFSIGTSERGDVSVEDENFSIPPFKHLLIVFGGVRGLEDAVSRDIRLKDMKPENTKFLFNMWANTCPGQGSRTIRTEEALFISLPSLKMAWDRTAMGRW